MNRGVLLASTGVAPQPADRAQPASPPRALGGCAARGRRAAARQGRGDRAAQHLGARPRARDRRRGGARRRRPARRGGRRRDHPRGGQRPRRQRHRALRHPLRHRQCLGAGSRHPPPRRSRARVDRGRAPRPPRSRPSRVRGSRRRALGAPLPADVQHRAGRRGRAPYRRGRTGKRRLGPILYALHGTERLLRAPAVRTRSPSRALRRTRRSSARCSSPWRGTRGSTAASRG